MPAGLSIAEILERVQPRELLRRRAYVAVGDWTVPRELYSSVRPKPGTRVTIRMLPSGGGSRDILRIVLLVAIAAAAVALPLAFPATAFAIGQTAISWGTLAAFGVSVVGAPCPTLLISREPPR
jgi:hypothetical protein